LGVSDGPVVSERAALEMAAGAARIFDAEVGLSLTGVAGPDEQDGQPVGTIWIGLSGAEVGGDTAHLIRLGRYGGGDRDQIRQIASISALDLLRRSILAGSIQP